MKYQSLPIATCYRRFRALASRLRKSLENGQFQLMTKKEQLELMTKLRRLYAQLSRVIGQRKLKRVLAAGALVLGLSFSSATAQTYGSIQISPFNLGGNSENLIVPVAADMDGDGDTDIIATAYESYAGTKIFYFENEGTADAPAYAERVNNPFGIVPPLNITALAVGDLDNDGDLDLIIGSYEDGGGSNAVFYFENSGSQTNPAYEAGLENPFGLTAVGGSSVPHLVDLDNDGDLDFMNVAYISGGNNSNLFYQENMGTATEPLFGAATDAPFGLPNPFTAIPLYDLADLDNDGDLDMIYGDGEYFYVGDTYRAALYFVENTGSASEPAFAAPVVEPFGIEYPDESLLAIPTVADFDDDGDLDIMSFVYVYSEAPNAEFNVFAYFENESPVVSTDELSNQMDWELFPSITRDELNWRLPESGGETNRLEVFTSIGQLVEVHTLAGLGGTISLKNLAAGNYWMRISTNDGSTYLTKQITKK